MVTLKGFQDDFYVQSEKFPLPTTVMGALRTSLLLESKLLLQTKKIRVVPDKPEELRKEATKLTGDEKLNNFEGTTGNFGIIEKLSPVFLVKNSEDSRQVEDAFFPVPEDVVKQTGECEENKKCRYYLTGYQEIDACSCSGSREYRKNFIVRSDRRQKTEKQGNLLGGKVFWDAYLQITLSVEKKADCFIQKRTEIIQEDSNRQVSIIDLDQENPFQSDSSVGIGMEKRRAAKGMFYVKNDFSLEKNYAFAVICRLTDDNVKFTKTITLGGENSVFFIKKEKLSDNAHLMGHPVIKAINEEETNLKNIFNNINGRCKVIGLSPLVLNDDIVLFEKAKHVISGNISNVRMLNSINLKDKSGKDLNKTKDYKNSPHIKDGKKIFKSDAYRIVREGFVFFFEDCLPINNLNTFLLPEKIGYNCVLKVPLVNA